MIRLYFKQKKISKKNLFHKHLSGLAKNLRLHIVSIHRNLYKNRLISKCARKSVGKVSEYTVI